MLSTTLRKRTQKLILLVLGVLAAVLAPLAPAHAAAEVPVGVPLNYQGVRLSALHGTLTFHSATRFSYSLVMCRDSSYSPPTTEVLVNGTSRHVHFYGGPNVVDSRCTSSGALLSNDVEYGSAVQNVTFCLRGVHFNGQTNQATSRERCITYGNPLVV